MTEVFEWSEAVYTVITPFRYPVSLQLAVIVSLTFGTKDLWRFIIGTSGDLVILRFVSSSFWSMTSIQVRLPCTWSFGVRENLFQGRFCHGPCFGYPQGQYHVCNYRRRLRSRMHPIFSSAVDDGMDPNDSGDMFDKDELSQSETEAVNSEILRENLERIVGTDDSAFSGIDLATLIRNKYGKSYDVQLIKKEFMGKNLLALNVMWKYVEQRSFPLSEEEYLLRLDDVANTLKCWGAVSHIRDSLTKLKERPRIGKAVSIFIDMDESGGRANEWIYNIAQEIELVV
ncbi:hypothetical protein RJ639_020344 [Escallonia herrerae]|uniref:Uncharacterized protein n=1 Tax=Escallonia herrerae TaxID=1293975 RepID=A0AA88V4M6_9ASTE|nr:hypothetical protein RJ639_020344 [Escallonia herrerae]